MKAELTREEATLRRHVVLLDESEETELYVARLPEAVHSVAAFERWRRETPDAESMLTFALADLRRPGAPQVDRAAYPE